MCDLRIVVSGLNYIRVVMTISESPRTAIASEMMM